MSLGIIPGSRRLDQSLDFPKSKADGSIWRPLKRSIYFWNPVSETNGAETRSTCPPPPPKCVIPSLTWDTHKLPGDFTVWLHSPIFALLYAFGRRRIRKTRSLDLWSIGAVDALQLSRPCADSVSCRSSCPRQVALQLWALLYFKPLCGLNPCKAQRLLHAGLLPSPQNRFEKAS